MDNKVLKLAILILQSLIFLLLASVCVYAVFSGSLSKYSFIKFSECFVRLVCLMCFTVFYVNSLAGGFGSDSLFMPLHLFFCCLTEFRIVDFFCNVFYCHFFPPIYSVYVFIFSALMTVLPLLGYCLFYNFSDSSNIDKFLVASVIGSLVVSLLMPKSQNLEGIWNGKALSVSLYVIYALALFVSVFVMITDTPGPSQVRHFVALILIVANYINLFYDTFVMNTIGTAFIILATVLIIILTKRNAIKL